MSTKSASVPPDDAQPISLSAASVAHGASSQKGPNGRVAIRFPTYDRSLLKPAAGGGITHLGIGAFHRAHLAVYLDDLLEHGNGSWSVTGSGVMPHDDRVGQLLGGQDGFYVVAEKEGDTATGRVIGSITNFVNGADDPGALLQNLSDPATKIVSITITEGGYPVEHGCFVESPELGSDMRADVPRSTFGLLAAALDHRRKAGSAPFTVMSCDNLPGNGDVAKLAVVGAASLRSPELSAWIERNGAFPNAMVDRITPATTDADRQWVTHRFGIRDAWPIICEPFRQWALQDTFVDGRPAFEEAGVLITGDVIPYEHMKLRLLNASHSALAYHAALAGYTYVHEAMNDSRIRDFIRTLMKDEAAPNLVSPGGIDLAEYQESLIHRFSNSAIADTISRLCLDGTAKFPTFLVPTAEAQINSGGTLSMVALTLAGWCRYLRGVADNNTQITHSHDPFLGEAIAVANASIADPRVFLAYERALGPNLAKSDRLVREFARALDSLDHIGSLATLDTWVTSAHASPVTG